VCFFGLTRSLQFTIDSIRSNVLDVLTAAGVKHTIYLHTHNVTRVFNPRSYEFNVTIDPTKYRLLRPDKFVLEQPVDWTQPKNQDMLVQLLKHGDAWRERDDHISLRNLVNQLQSLEKLTSLWTPSASEFDAAIYLRSDVWFYNRLDVSQLLEAAGTTSHPVIWTPNFATYTGLNDRFAFGNVAAMQIYGNRWQHALAYAHSANMHAERFLNHTMRSNGVECRTTDIVFTRVRGGGLVVDMPIVDAKQRVNTTHIRGSASYRMVRSPSGTWQLQRTGQGAEGAIPLPGAAARAKATAT
jgi:hypothetical protein